MIRVTMQHVVLVVMVVEVDHSADRALIQIQDQHLIVQLMRNLFMLHLELLHVEIKVVDVQLLNAVL